MFVQAESDTVYSRTVEQGLSVMSPGTQQLHLPAHAESSAVLGDTIKQALRYRMSKMAKRLQ